MSQSIETVLKNLLDREGTGLLGESGRLKSFLHDECPEAKREISVLLLALDEHVPQDLMRVHSGEPIQSLGPRLAKRLSEEKAMDRNASDWAVRTWARGLGVASGGTLDGPLPVLDADVVSATGQQAASVLPAVQGAATPQASALALASTSPVATTTDVRNPASRNYLVIAAVAIAAIAGAWYAFFQPQLKIVGVSTAEALVGDGKRRDVVVDFKAAKSPVQKIVVRHLSGDAAGNPETWTANVPVDAATAGHATVGQLAVRSTKPTATTYEYVLVAADGEKSEPFAKTFDIAPAPTQPATITSVELRSPQYVGKPFTAALSYRAGSSDVAQIEVKVVESTGRWVQDVFTQNATGTTGKQTGSVPYTFAPASAPMRATVEFSLISADGAKSEAKRVAIDVLPQTAGMLAGLPTGVVLSVREGAVQPAETSGAGAVIGGIVGGVLGNQVGRGTGRTLATIGGAAGGAVVGNQIEKGSGGRKVWNVSVKLDDGRTQAFTSSSAPTVRTGERVKIVNGAVQSDR